jgi:hypothetical protein
MKPQTLLFELKLWFEDYVSRFTSNDPLVQENIELKAEHTLRVCEAIKDIGASLNLSGEEFCQAEITALLHDIGRFEQYRRYRTFADYQSEDHAGLGVQVIRTEGILQDFEQANADMIIRVVGHHNRANLPQEEEARCLFFLKLLRDADKVDIWHVVTEYYQNSDNNRNPALELDLPDEDRVSDSAYEALMKGNLVQMMDLKSLNDFKLLQLGWVYDLNFRRTFQIVRERRYLEKIRQALPQNLSRVEEVYDRVKAYLERHASGG